MSVAFSVFSSKNQNLTADERGSRGFPQIHPEEKIWSAAALGCDMSSSVSARQGQIYFIMPMSDKPRCPWATTPAMIAYHDDEWGLPQHDDRVLFEFLVLEGAQAGLSWSTILAKREAYRKAFSRFDPAKVARYKSGEIKRLMKDAGIVRNRLKIESAIRNAQALVTLQKEFGSFDRYIWQFVGGAAITNSRHSMKNLPAETRESLAMSKDLKRRGFNFVGPTVCYAFMQAVGMVNDHLVTCFRYADVGKR